MEESFYSYMNLGINHYHLNFKDFEDPAYHLKHHASLAIQVKTSKLVIGSTADPRKKERRQGKI